MSATKLDRATIDHVASLASVSLGVAEAATMTTEIGAILAYVEELGTLDTADVPPTGRGSAEEGGVTAWRADVISPGLSREDALAAAPRVADDGFAVPGFVDGASPASPERGPS